MQTKELFTRKRHNEGIKVDIRDESGVVVGWIRCRGLDSDAYRAAHDSYNRAMVRLAKAVRADPKSAVLPPESLADKAEAELAERAALVIEWSFETPCTEETIRELLTEAPQLSDAIFYVASDRDRFLEHALPNSSDGPATGSKSESQP
jgi:hypothetical protein